MTGVLDSAAAKRVAGRHRWDIHFMREAALWAELSKDPERKVGAVAVSHDRRQLSTGYNGFPRGVEDTAGRLGDGQTRLRLSVHAELNALLNNPTSMQGWTLYSTFHPCMDCAKVAIQKGIARLVCTRPDEGSSWFSDQTRAASLLREAFISVDHL